VVEDNQQRLFNSIKQAFACANKTPTLHVGEEHGWVEAWEYHLLHGGNIAKAFPDWGGLKSIVMAKNHPHNGQNKSLE
jgi:hypothetical protein